MSIQDLVSLHPQHKKFADEFLATSKVSASAVAAGYSKRSAHVSGNRLLKRPDVQRYLASRVAEHDKSAEELGVQVINELKTMAFVNIADFVSIDKDGLPHVDFSKATPEQLRAIASIKSKTTDRYDNKGNRIATDKESAFTVADKYRGLELLGKHVGLFKADEQKVIVDVADRLLTARRRLGRDYDETGEAQYVSADS